MKNSLLHDSFENRDGILYFGGVNTVELAEKFGTPLFVYDQERIQSNINRVRRAFQSRYNEFLMLYAIKAMNNSRMLDVIAQKTDGADASRSTEIELAQDAEFPMISYSGNFATNESLISGLKNADIINFDSIEAFQRLMNLIKNSKSSPPIPNSIKGPKLSPPKRITFRINPGFGQGSFENNVFAGHDAKFGIRHEDAVDAYKQAKEAGVEHFGIYMMTGSCVLDPSYFEKVTEKLLDIAGKIRKEVGIQFEWINIGGGFGIPYRPDEKSLDIEKVAEKVIEMLRKKAEEYDLGHPTLMVEPGRYIVGDAGILLTTVQEVKNLSYQPYVGTDAGMNTLLRSVLYPTAYHDVLMANRMNAKPGKKRTIVGGICENTDKIARNRKIPTPKEGDILTFLCTGAYGFSMSFGFNTIPLDAEVLVRDGKAKLIRKRQTLKNMMSNVVPRENP
ncbi:diaminopimelate decarboxylase [Candidatus Peregrinibacteria bacterium]|nr:diaminopimelate decarboxylase [Candidatus Peregrinibacteria bacterium]